MRKVISVLVGVIFAISVLGCGGAATAPPMDAQTAEHPTAEHPTADKSSEHPSEAKSSDEHPHQE